MPPFYAHTTDGPPEEWHLLAEHLRDAAETAARLAAKFQSAKWAFLAGLFHDLGKFSEEFQKYLKRSAESSRRQGRVNHSTAGAVEARRLMAAAGSLGALYGSVLAYIIAGHHGGLSNGGATSLDSGTLKNRLAAAIPAYDAWRSEIETPPLPQAPPPPLVGAGKADTPFAVSLFVRLLFSCLVEADWLDTEGFCSPDKKEARDSLTPSGPAQLQRMREQLRARLDELAAGSQSSSPLVHGWRQKVLGYCRAAGAAPPESGSSVYSLTVPTGGGKTLAALAFALERAAVLGLDRVIYVAPFISIIDQTAQIFRDIFGLEAVLEHHSDYLHPGDDAEEETPEALAATRARLASQNWSAPLVVTTAVQFFESLFAAKPSRCRKLHNICRSVVILDEAQNIPLHLLAPTTAALKELARSYGVTLVLCTATQPALDKTHHLPKGFKAGQVKEIIPAEVLGPLFSDLRRVEFSWLGRISDGELAEKMLARSSALAVANTKAEAQRLFEALGPNEEGHYLLTSRFYPAHRRRLLESIRRRLKEGLVCRLVSTSLVEAGVDVDFQCAFRALAGLDNIAQAAGRANRHGLLAALGEVFIYLPETGLPARAPSLGRRAAATEYFLGKGTADLLNPEIQKEFFKRLYEGEGGLDAENILGLLARADPKDYSNLPFREIADKYRFIDDGQESVVVVWDKDPEAAELAQLVENLRQGRDVARAIRKLQRYTVSVYPGERQALYEAGALELINGQFWVTCGLVKSYSERLGLICDGSGGYDTGIY